MHRRMMALPLLIEGIVQVGLDRPLIARNGLAAMDSWPLPADEALRLDVLPSYGLIGSSSEPVFDALTSRVAHLLDVPICLITVVGEQAQWIKSGFGLDVQATPRCQAFCAHTIITDEILYVADARQDARFRENPLVTGEPQIRFYAGAPIVTDDGAHLGALCAIDTKARRDVDAGLLWSTAAVVAELFNQRRFTQTARSADQTLFADERSAVERAAQILRAQQSIGGFFDPALFGNPTLSMLLTLFIAAREGRSLSISECCEAAGLPFTSGQRLVQKLIQSRVLQEMEDASDKRKRRIAAPAACEQKMENWLLSI